MSSLLCRSRIAFEAHGGFDQQFGRHGQIDTRGGHVHVAQVRRQERQACLDIGALAIPRDEAMDGKGGAEIVRARPMSWMPLTDVGLPQQTRESRLQTSERDRSSASRHEEDRAITIGERQPGPLRVVLRERTTQVGPDGYESRFEEFGIPDGEEMVAEVDVAAAQAKRLARAESRAVQEQEHETECVRLNECRRMDGLRGGVEQPANVVTGIDVSVERGLNLRTGLRQRRVAQVPSPDEVPKEATECLVLAGPESRRWTLTAAERGATSPA